MIKALQKLIFKDQDLAQMFTLVSGKIDEIIRSPIIDGVLVEVTLGTSTVLVNHGLQRPWRTWTLCDNTADARVWRDTAADTRPSVYLPLTASASCTVKVWVT